jgi:hypothetical protein
MMPQVVTLFRPRLRSRDWTNEELAELYRVEGALVQARILVETDRGITDEGDPWFVFCRPDGDVLVHIARFEGLYWLYTPALADPLTGSSFRALTQTFLDSFPVHVPVERGQGARLFVHPAATLALVIGTIFYCSDAMHAEAATETEASPDTALASKHDAVGKPGLQKLVAAYLESLSAMRADSSSSMQHSSSYLGFVASLAFVLGSDSFPQAGAPDGGLGGVLADAARQNAGVGAVLQGEPPASTGPENRLAKAGPLAAGELAQSEAAGNTLDAAGAPPATKLAMAHIDVDAVPIIGALSDARDADPEPTFKTDWELQVASPGTRFMVTVEAAPQEMEARIASRQVTTVESSGPETMAPISTAEAAHANEAHRNEGTEDQAGDRGHARPEAQTLREVSAVDAWAADASRIRDEFLRDLVDDGPTGAPAGAEGTGFKRFDHDALKVLADFLDENPNNKILGDRHNVIVYDGMSGPAGTANMTVTVWELDKDTTIAIVGHAEVGAPAYI